MKINYIPTGNERIAIPEIVEADASIQSINFLHMGYKGLVEIRGGSIKDSALMQPVIKIGGTKKELTNIHWNRVNYWIPSFEADCGEIRVSGVIIAPVSERGFIYRLSVVNRGHMEASVSLGVSGSWQETLHTINESKPMHGIKHAYGSGWNNSFVFDFRDTAPVFSLAPIYEEKMEVEFYERKEDGSIRYELFKEYNLQPGDRGAVTFYWGLGFEEVGAATAAKEMMRKGFEKEWVDTTKWLSCRQKISGNGVLDQLLNMNLFFNFFYASGITLDTEDFVLVTSRSPRYYVSAAYWDRDSLLWSFPSILLTDQEHAKGMLEYVFTRQIKNVGIHSRYIDGTILEPGFELDELCAPVIALHNYIKQTQNSAILTERYIIKGIERILSILDSKKNERADLYETFLQPTDDLIVYPYLTYDNVLVWKALLCIAEMMAGVKEDQFCCSLKAQAERIKEAVWKHCIFELDGKKIFAWSTDLEGRWNAYDEPPGSLQLLPFYGFCSSADEVYRLSLIYI
ncbi:MAG: glycoside hydrolase family 125 protein, partial [Clostridia bacterium]|nr:glycoside hydrolase family 125 protein [Clostridia bacterium]